MLSCRDKNARAQTRTPTRRVLRARSVRPQTPLSGLSTGASLYSGADGRARRVEAVDSRQKWYRAITVVGALLITALALEVAFRITYSLNGRFAETKSARTSGIFVKSANPALIYEHRPDFFRDGARITDSHGIKRSERVPVEKPPGETRIVVLGDSISARGSWTTLLERRLNESNPFGSDVVKVLNFAVDGYRTTQEAELLSYRAIRFQPDLLLVQYCMNDVGNNITPTRWFLDPPLSYLVEFIGRHTGLGQDPALSDAVPVFGPNYNTKEYWVRMYDPASKSWGSVESGFERISVLARERDIPVMLLIFPFLIDGWRSDDVDRIHEQVKSAGEDSGFSVIDLLKEFERQPAVSLRIAPRDIYHPNETGQAIAASAVLESMPLVGRRRTELPDRVGSR